MTRILNPSASGVSADTVTLTGTQTLTNKTLTSPKINEDVALTSTATELNTLDNSVPRKCVLFGSSAGVSQASNTTKYHGMFTSDDAYTSAFVMPCGGTIKNLYIFTGGAPGAGQTYVGTMMNNNSDQTLTCTISGGASNSASDTSNSFSVSASNRISLKLVKSVTATAGVVQFSVEFDAS